MARKKGGGHGGGHGWFVTFADLMGLLMSFFVMLTAFSTQDQKKLQIVAGSMREAFGTQKQSKLSGIVEIEGLPVRPHMRYVERTTPDKSSEFTGPRQTEKPTPSSALSGSGDRALSQAVATLRQAMQDLPEIAEVSKNVLIEETAEGFDIQIVDQDGRAMFGEGEARPNDRATKILDMITDKISQLANPIRITGHSSSSRLNVQEAGGWAVSTQRALIVRERLAGRGIPRHRFESVAGKADSEPLFQGDPGLSANRRVSIVLVRMAPPLPPAK
ncbi:MAG TPA: flagellar motor protein MotB [Beijerinckiaceae bacterium]|nr:flagellar motor protein MotB [Beijerinckiaceae bacterium]